MCADCVRGALWWDRRSGRARSERDTCTTARSRVSGKTACLEELSLSAAILALAGWPEPFTVLAVRHHSDTSPVDCGVLDAGVDGRLIPNQAVGVASIANRTWDGSCALGEEHLPSVHV